MSLCDGKAVYHNNYGAVLRDLDRHDEACAAFRRAIELRADYPDAHANLGLHFLGVSDYEAAQSSLQQALRWNPRHVDALLHSGELYRTLGRLACPVNKWHRNMRFMAGGLPNVGYPIVGIVDYEIIAPLAVF